MFTQNLYKASNRDGSRGFGLDVRENRCNIYEISEFVRACLSSVLPENEEFVQAIFWDKKTQPATIKQK